MPQNDAAVKNAKSLTDSLAINGQITSNKKHSTPLAYADFPSHPTQSLRFLNTTDHRYGNTTSHLQAKVKLRAVIVGAGLGGLGCAIALARRGHTVTVLEQAPQLGEVGAGIQIPSNSSRLLLSWGLGPYLEPHAVEPSGMHFRRRATGDVITYTKLIPNFRDKFDAPFYVMHRAHFQDALQKRAVELGVDIKLGHRVENYDLETPKVFLGSGESLEADLVVACDGVKSVARKLVLGGEDDAPQHTGFAAYRATVHASKMKNDPQVSWLLEKPSLNAWIGGEKHVMSYTIAAGESFNMVLSHIDRTDPSTWNSKSPDEILEEMQETFSGWDPCLTKVMGMVQKTLKWPLMSGKPLNRWVAPSTKVLIMGDAAHAMVPYISQGAAMAIEDGAALAAVLSMIESADEIPEALKAFETERIHRSSQMQGASLLNGKLWHFEDGPEQRLRDESMKAEVEGKDFTWSPNQWSDPVTQRWAYGYDAEREMENWFTKSRK